MKLYERMELTFRGEVLKNDWARVDLSAVFQNGEEEVKVKGFYDGDGVYKVRFLPLKTGTWSWKVTGILEASGQEECVAGEAEEGLHGPVRARGMHFSYEDGTRFAPFGTTIYAMLHQERERIDQTFATLAKAPFNKVRLCVFPKHYDFNHNEPEFYAFEKDGDKWDVGRPSIAFWHHFEEGLARLEKMGIQADLILFHPYDRWGFSSLTQAENLEYLDYLLRRLAAFPNVWWSLANEYDFCLGHKTVEDFEEIEEYVASHDPYHHLLSNHNCFKHWDFTRPNVTHACIQTKDLTKVTFWREQYRKPVVIDECAYEGDIPHFWGSISGREMTARFWRVVTSGAYCTHGETFLDDQEVLWWAKGCVLKGESPKRIAFLKALVEELPGPIDSESLGMEILAGIKREQEETVLANMPEEFRSFAKAFLRMDEVSRMGFCGSEHCWQGHCGELAYLYYYDLRCCSRDVLHLPETHTYRIEIIDTWEMTRQTLLAGVKGQVEVNLPGKEGTAVLALAEA